ncbi:hypothetical protein P7C73_g5880, partial [Tremellales sp. Uapishka_1]
MSANDFSSLIIPPSPGALPDVDWEMYLDLGEASGDPSQTSGEDAVVSDIGGQSPGGASTESEQSEALDPPAIDVDLSENDDSPNFAMGTIRHSPGDISLPLPQPFGVNAPFQWSSSPPTFLPDPNGTTDRTMTATFSTDFSNFGEYQCIDNNFATQAALATGLDLRASVHTEFSNAADLGSSPESTGLRIYTGNEKLWADFAALPVQHPATVSPHATEMKRKASESSVESVMAPKRPRGRPPGSTKSPTSSLDSDKSGSVPLPPVKRPYKRQSKSTSLASPALACTYGFEGPSTPVAIKSGNPSAARPKAVVPEKFFKNGEAVQSTGMTEQEIRAYPNWETLMMYVDEAHRAAAEAFGDRINGNRNKARDAAAKSREDKKNENEQLRAQNEEMRQVLRGLVERGIVSYGEVAYCLK